MLCTLIIYVYILSVVDLVPLQYLHSINKLLVGIITVTTVLIDMSEYVSKLMSNTRLLLYNILVAASYKIDIHVNESDVYKPLAINHTPAASKHVSPQLPYSLKVCFISYY